MDRYTNAYGLYGDTVSIYHYENDEVTKAVYSNVHFEFNKTLNIQRTGSAEVNGFLLVVPGTERACQVGDKVLLGDGVDVPTENVAAWWRSFIPSKVDGLVVVKNVDVRRLNGGNVHTEAGG